MQFTPLNLDELTTNVWPEGAYEFKVQDANEVDGMYGPQIALDMEVSKGEKTKKVKTWLNAKSPKLAFFCVCVGLKDKYEMGQILDSDCMYKKGYVMLSVGKTKNGDSINNVSKFLTKSEYESMNGAPAPEQKPKKEESFDEDTIPF